MYKPSRKISTLIESQLPSFISTEYENFSKFLGKYYEHLESKGNVLDIINNITTYFDVDYYDSNTLTEYTTCTSSFSSSASSISVQDATSFPEENGYIKIDNEICFYEKRTDNVFQNVTRGISGTTKLGDLYQKSNFVASESASHFQGAKVYNLSNLFLYALVKHFEDQYLKSFPKKSIKPQIDKKLLLKNIKQFYSAKGTEYSIKFIFNSIVSQTSDDIPEIFYPKDQTVKISTSDWTNNYSIRVKLLSGNINNLIGQTISQTVDNQFASATIDNISPKNVAGKIFYELILAPESIVGKFEVCSKTKLRTSLSTSTSSRINVFSTYGWDDSGFLLIDDEVIEYSDKNITQFVQKSRQSPISHAENAEVYSIKQKIESNNVSFLILGVAYNLNLTEDILYCSKNDSIQFKNFGTQTKDTIVYNKLTDSFRWLTSNSSPVLEEANVPIQQKISNFSVDTSSVFQDSDYYYICSSGIPSHSILKANVNILPEEQKILRLIKKTPVSTTEIYKTPFRDVGIFLNGVLAYGNKDDTFITYGKIVSSTIIDAGIGYTNPPYVLIDGQPNKATATIAGGRLEKIEVTTNETFSFTPTIEIVAGRKATARAVVTGDTISSIRVINQGEYYSAPPRVVITDSTGKGKFAEYKAILNAYGQVIRFEQINAGKFYSQGTVTVTLLEDARGSEAQAKLELRKWYKNRYYINSSYLDNSNGYLFQNYESIDLDIKKYGYGYVANPKRLRYQLSDNLQSNLTETTVKTHSPILGYAYDGNPIYGPYGYSSPLDNTSNIVRLESGYTQNVSRSEGPSTSTYPLGYFTDDFSWNASVNVGKTILDKNNGRFCVTPEYPEGTYAYFITINSSNQPVFPYIIGENYYSFPVELNYTTSISQNNLPSNAKKVFSPPDELNGLGSVMVVNDVLPGTITDVNIEDSIDTFKVGNKIYVNNENTEGENFQAVISEVEGKEITSIQSVQVKSLLIKTQNIVYIYEGDTITQQSTGATGIVVGDVFDSNTIVLRNVSGTFNQTNLISSNINTIKIITQDNCNFSAGETLYLTNNDNDIIATGVILNSISSQNTLKIKVLSGTFTNSTTHYIKSSSLNDSTGIFISSVESLSKNKSISELNDKIAIVTTNENHGLSIGDTINVDITPNDTLTETLYYVRKKQYQSILLNPPTINCQINDTGIGRYEYLNGGYDYATGTYEDVELIFKDQTKIRYGIGKEGDVNNARVNITVNNINGSNRGIAKITAITQKGSGYKKGDVLTVSDNSLSRWQSSLSTQRLIVVVDHVAFAKEETILYLNNVQNISINDIVLIDEEKLKVLTIDEPSKLISVQRGIDNTAVVDHYQASKLSLVDPKYNFTKNYRPLGVSANNPYVSELKDNTLIVNYDYSVTTPNTIQNNSSFYDNSSPAKLVSIKQAYSTNYQFEFSKNNISNFVNSPIIDLKKYYKYKFDTSHSSLNQSYFSVSSGVNGNIIPIEFYSNDIEPGYPGSFSTLKIGFSNNFYINGTSILKNDNTAYSKYYYYDKKGQVKAFNGYFNLINDPLQGLHTILYKSGTRFVYNLVELPDYDGSGTCKYTTTSKTAIGKITKISILNRGKNYYKLPVVIGAEVASEYECKINPIYDSINKNINSVEILNFGQNYQNPIVTVDGDGNGAKFEIITEAGEITKIKVINSGKNYTFKPTLKVVESNIKVFLDSDNLGKPKDIKIIDNGYGYGNDNSTTQKASFPLILFLKDFGSNTFYPGEQIVQTALVQGQIKEICSGIVTNDGWRDGSNILKLKDVIGIFDNSLPIKSKLTNNTANITKIIQNKVDVNLKYYFDNVGYFNSDKGKINEFSQNITDSYYYQDYSYVIKSKTQFNEWKDVINISTHPAGFKLFGELSVKNDADVKMEDFNSSKKHIESISYINVASNTLKKCLLAEIKKETEFLLKSQISNNENLNLERGFGSISIDTFNNTETISRELILTPKFDGTYDSTGNLVGTKTFTLLDKKTRLAVSPYNEQELVITLDGILQEPKKAFKISGNQIIFSEPPLGERTEKFGKNNDEVVSLPSQKFYCKAFKFKDNTLNSKYLKKFKNISSEFDGVKQEFNLYYENGDIVKSDAQEKLLVCLNGVLQKAKKYYNDPSKNSYFIERSTNNQITDKIVFSSAPAFNDSSDLNKRTDTKENCFIYSIGSYERLTIDKTLIPYKKNGPYLIVNEVSDTVTQIDNELYPLVFVDGVLQIRGESYEINGATITFSKPLNYYISESGEDIYSDVSIIIPYGRELEKSLTLYDFEPDTYYNTILITLQGTSIYTTVNNIYTALNDYDNVLVYQGSDLFGELKYISGSGNSVTITAINSLNLNREIFDNSTPIKFVINGTDTTISGTYTITFDYVKDIDGNKILQYGAYTGRSLYGTNYKQEIEERRKLKRICKIYPGDFIKIDGEDEFRKITSISNDVRPKNNIPNTYASSEIYTTALCTNYNGISKGEGLSVSADISNGTVTSLKWNKTELELYLQENLLLQPTAYRYYTNPILQFIPIDGNGGGAKAEVIVHDGAVLDVVLINGGSGYTDNPIVKVARGFVIKKQNPRKMTAKIHTASISTYANTTLRIRIVTTFTTEE